MGVAAAILFAGAGLASVATMAHALRTYGAAWRLLAAQVERPQVTVIIYTIREGR